ncbi:MAG: RDD family protein [Bryobacteraceae bacterium]
MTAAPTTSALRIETPEGVTFSLQLASPVLRALAWGLDAAVLMAAYYMIGKGAGLLAFLGSDWANALAMVVYFAASVAYGMALEWYWRGQTIGKRLFGLRVVDAHGLRLRPAQVILRNLLRAIDLLPGAYLTGVVSCVLSRRGQRLGDLAANTIVLRETKRREPDIEHIAPAKYNSLLAVPHLAARLRSRVDPDAVRIAVTALAQRDGYDPGARVQLFKELADYFRLLVTFPESVVEGLTDEQYVRSAVRALYGR